MTYYHRFDLQTCICHYCGLSQRDAYDLANGCRAGSRSDVEIWCSKCERVWYTPEPPDLWEWLREHRVYGLCAAFNRRALFAAEPAPGVTRS